MTRYDLTGRTVAITGSTGGLGSALAGALRARGANLALLDLDAVWIAGEHGWESRSDNCCFAGRELTGRVLLTVADGSVAYRERAFALTAA